MQSYTIQPGDTLSKISEKIYGDQSMVTSIAMMNNIKDVNLIYPGTKLTMPDKKTEDIQDAVVVEDGKNKKWLWLLLLAAAAGGGYYYYKKQQKKKKSLGEPFDYIIVPESTDQLEGIIKQMGKKKKKKRAKKA